MLQGLDVNIVQTNQLERAARVYGDITNYFKANQTSFTLECLALGHTDHVLTCRYPSGAVEWELKMMLGGTAAVALQAMKNMLNKSRYDACITKGNGMLGDHSG